MIPPPGRAIVLTAGVGARLRPLSYCRAKPAVPVAGTPLIGRILAWLARQDVRDVVLNLHYKPETITGIVGDGTDFGVRVRYSWEPRILGSAGGPRRALPLLESRFVIVNGDTLTDLDLHELVAAHVRTRARVTLAVVPSTDPRRYGGVLAEEDGWVCGFTRAGDPRPAYHFVGVQVVEAEVFADLPDGQPAATIGGFYSSLMAQEHRALRAHLVSAAFHDIGTPADFLKTSLVLARAEGLDRLPRGAGTHVDRTARVTRTSLWDNVVVEESCELTDCVVGDGVRVPRGSRFDGQAIVVARDQPPLKGEQRVGDLLVAPLAPPDRDAPGAQGAVSGSCVPAQRLLGAPRDRIASYLGRVGLTGRSTSVVPLTGDASDRRYFRVILERGRSLVLAVYAEPLDYDTLPFVNVAELLGRMPVPVPAIQGHEADLGILVLEDLGDLTLQAHVEAEPAQDHTPLYRQAVGLIEVLQRRGSALASPAYRPYGSAFDVEKLMWELDFFVEHFVKAHRGAAIPAAALVALGDEFKRIAEELAGEPRVLCHRDYHSRNLLLHAGQLYVIDFQDARMGPRTYDLASLLRDSYVDLSDHSVDALLTYFLEITGERTPPVEFRERFDLMALQRNLKALGTFGYQATTASNPRYLQYIPRTLRYARDTLRRDARFARLHEVLAPHVEELR